MNLAACQLRYFPDLSSLTVEEVNAEENYIRVIPDEFLPRGLKKLKMDANYLQADGLPPTFPNSLEELSLNKNNLTDFREVNQFPPNLKKLSVSNNPLHTMTNLDHESIEELEINKTNIETISLLPRRLERLGAMFCYISMIPNRLPSTIRVLNLNHNCLYYAGLPGYWGTSLEELHLSHNKIERFPRNLPPSLKILHLGHNRISQLPDSLNKQLPALEVLGLAKNKIQTVPLEARHKPIKFVNLSENELVVAIDESNRDLARPWANTIILDKNWNTKRHESSAHLIQKNWRLSRIRARIRTWKRIGLLKEELLCVSMMPERVWQTDVISDEWKRTLI